MTTGDTLVSFQNVSKKFCRALKRSLFYAVTDLAAELSGRNAKPGLRKKEFWAVHGVSMELHRGEVLGLIGPNGSGKTTLLRMANGLIKPNEGRIEARGRMVALIALGAGFSPILTGRENIYANAAILGLSKAEVNRCFDEIVSFSMIEQFLDSPVQSYSSGMRVRLGFAVAAHLDPDILLVDEVLAVGDLGFQRKCLNKIGELRDTGTGIILVSHNMHTISTYASRLSVLSDGCHTSYDNVHEGIRAYRQLFSDSLGADEHRICSGNESIRFDDVRIPNDRLRPGDSFVLELGYSSEISYLDAEVDLGIYSTNEPNLHFQATNRAYGKSVNLTAGRHCLRIILEDIRINGGKALIACAIWSRDRREQLFWWRIPVSFEPVEYSTGNNFINVTFEHLDQDGAVTTKFEASKRHVES